jgi:hypothetical protein
MASLNNKHIEKRFPPKETVLLHFDKRDSQIARAWSKAAEDDGVDEKD